MIDLSVAIFCDRLIWSIYIYESIMNFKVYVLLSFGFKCNSVLGSCSMKTNVSIFANCHYELLFYEKGNWTALDQHFNVARVHHLLSHVRYSTWAC